MANVYVFNTWNQALGLVLNGYPGGTLTAATTGTYAPTSTAIARNPAPGNPGMAQFGGTNSLIVAYGSSGVAYTYPITGIAYSDVPSDQDLQLYIYYNLAVLVKQASAGPVATPGTQPSAEELELLAAAIP